MNLDLMSARQRKRRDEKLVVIIDEPEPSTVVHLFQPNHPDYEAAGRVHDAKMAELDKHKGVFA